MCFPKLLIVIGYFSHLSSKQELVITQLCRAIVLQQIMPLLIQFKVLGKLTTSFKPLTI
jgi:hypothetical protein